MTLTVRTRRRPYRPGEMRPLAKLASYMALLIFAAIYIFPFLIELGSSFKTDSDASNHPLNPIPHQWVLTAFRALYDQDFLRWFANSAIVALSVTAGRIVFDSMAGYALARLRFSGRRTVFSGIIAVMAVPSVVLMIPKFLVLNELRIYDSYSGMIIPLLADAAGVFIMKQFFESIPRSIEEAASIDGAGIFRTYWSIVLPMARPALITLTILSFQGSWNELSHFIISRQNPKLNTLTTGVASLVSGQLGAGSQYPLKLAAALLMTVPVAIVFFVFQRHIMRTGAGAIKE
ncbi:carbohydrate ABC transporter permease [Streptomyces sp. NPDC046900]|uniref:carbohydrate ABC transporter permease n=1 Tax=Streptomyces sp. NPDC046900 TaxID=3155473 RepID=UPI0033CA54A2